MAKKKSSRFKSLSDIQPSLMVRTVPTVDALLGGGVRMGQIMEILSEPSVGKTTLSLYIAKCVQDEYDVPVALIDTEYRLGKEFLDRIGLNPGRTWVYQAEKPDDLSASTITNLALNVLRKEKVVLIIDSITNLIPDSELEGGGRIGEQAAIISRFVRHASPLCAVHNSLCICINQWRSQIRGMGQKPTPTGGYALAHLVSTKIVLFKGSDILHGGDIMGHEVHVAIKKSLTSPPTPSVAPKTLLSFPLLYSEGVDYVGDLANWLLRLGMAVRRGSWYEIELEGELLKVQGWWQLRETLKGSNLLGKVQHSVYELIGTGSNVGTRKTLQASQVRQQADEYVSSGDEDR